MTNNQLSSIIYTLEAIEAVRAELKTANSLIDKSERLERLLNLYSIINPKDLINIIEHIDSINISRAA